MASLTPGHSEQPFQRMRQWIYGVDRGAAGRDYRRTAAQASGVSSARRGMWASARPGRAAAPLSTVDAGGRQTPRTTALTGFEPTGIMVNNGALLVRLAVMAAMRITAMSPDRRLSTSAY